MGDGLKLGRIYRTITKTIYFIFLLSTWFQQSDCYSGKSIDKNYLNGKHLRLTSTQVYKYNLSKKICLF